MTIGILPCAGKAERFNGLPKALLPCPEGFLLQRHVINMKKAGCEGVGVCTNEEMYPILEPYCRYQTIMSNYYDRLLTVEKYETMTETVISFYNYCKGMGESIKHHNIIFGMPDTYTDANQIYPDVLNILENTGCDLVVGLFHVPVEDYSSLGMCRLEGDKVVEVIDKSKGFNIGDFHHAWGMLAWTPAFWECLKPDMPHVGYGIQVAIDKGMDVHACTSTASYYDCGTPERYFRMIREMTEPKPLMFIKRIHDSE